MKIEILHILENESLSARELAKKLGNSSISKTLKQVIEELESESLIKQIKSGRTSAIQITKFGKNFIK